jgi:hypothetical protein
MYYGNGSTATAHTHSSTGFNANGWTNPQEYLYNNQISFKTPQNSLERSCCKANDECIDQKSSLASYMSSTSIKTQYEKLQANTCTLYWNDYIENFKYFSNGNYNDDYSVKRLGTNAEESFNNMASSVSYSNNTFDSYNNSNRDSHLQDLQVASYKGLVYKSEKDQLNEMPNNFKLFKNTDENSRESDLSRNGATLRERNRMHILNDAFDDLRKIVPKSNLSEHQRLSKIATLRLAIHYISTLTKILQNTGGIIPLDPSLLPVTPRRRRRKKSAILHGQTMS